jgi:glutaminase
MNKIKVAGLQQRHEIRWRMVGIPGARRVRQAGLNSRPAVAHLDRRSSFVELEMQIIRQHAECAGIGFPSRDPVEDTLACGGVNPLTKQRVIDAAISRYALAVITTAGMYETSGDWLYEVGLPGKSGIGGGIGGGIVTVSPGKGALGTFAPPLDATGTSVKGQLAAKFLSQRLGLDLFVSMPLP